MGSLLCEWLGRVGVEVVLKRQEALRERVIAGDDEAQRILFVEHDPVLTLGRTAKKGHVLLSEDELRRRGVQVYRSSRGGDVTYHGPGQLVIYPVVKLRNGVLDHVRTIGEVIAEELGALGVIAKWLRDPAGVWVANAKIAACGIHVRHNVAIHGYALNVQNIVLDGFRNIVPCGISGVVVTTIEQQLDRQPLALDQPPALEPIAKSIAERLCKTWKRSWEYSCDLTRQR